MNTLNNVVLTACDVMGWREDDVYALNCWLEAYANLLGSNQEEKALHCVKSAMALEGVPITDINCWYKATLTLIFYELLQAVRLNENEHIKSSANALAKRFSPHIDCANSKLNNCFDNIDFEQPRDVIIAQAIELLGSEKNNRKRSVKKETNLR